MNFRTSIATAFSACLVLASCGGESTPKSRGSKGAGAAGIVHGGLIAARSGDAAAAANFLILRPAGAGQPWTTELVQGRSMPAELWLGRRKSDGSTVWRSTTPETAPIDQALMLTPAKDGWTLQPIDGLALTDVDWSMRKVKDAPDVPVTKSYQLAAGNVCHKAMWFEPKHGEPGILTITANSPVLAIWRKSAAGWESETLWTEFVGDDEQRLRDVEVGDVDGDGDDEIVVVTHNRGGVYVLDQTPEGLVAQRIDFTSEPIFVHEVELGHADDDGMLEIFTTPSEPNRFDGKEQAGRIDRFDYVDGVYVQSIVEDDPASHAKEILAVDINGDGRVEIFAALEAKELRPDFTSDYPGYLNMYSFDAAGKVTRTVVGDLIGAMCRFLVAGDTDGDGVMEIVASTSKDGILSFQLDGTTWNRRKVAGGFRSSGFEHAITLLDVNGDGTLDIVAGSDYEKQYSAFVYDKARGRWNQQKLCDGEQGIYITWCLMPLPKGQ